MGDLPPSIFGGCDCQPLRSRGCQPTGQQELHCSSRPSTFLPCGSLPVQYLYRLLWGRLTRMPIVTGLRGGQHFPFLYTNRNTWTPSIPVFIGILALRGGIYRMGVVNLWERSNHEVSLL